MPTPKLNKVEREILKLDIEGLREKGGGVFSFPDTGMTVAIEPAGKVAHVSMAIMADDEPKFRAKVGKQKAIERLFNGECVTVPLPNSLEEFANEFVSQCEAFR